MAPQRGPPALLTSELYPDTFPESHTGHVLSQAQWLSPNPWFLEMLSGSRAALPKSLRRSLGATGTSVSLAVHYSGPLSTL